MPTLVQAPDGKRIQFPDTMDKTAIETAMQKLYPPAKPQPMPWSEVGKQALSNFPSSAVQTGENIVSPFLHNPVHVAERLGKALEHPGVLASNVIKGIKDRYGSVEAFKHTLATDPAGAMLDISSVLAPFSGTRAVQSLSEAARPVTQAVGRGIKKAASVPKNVISEEVARASRMGKGSIQEAFKGTPGFKKQFFGGSEQEAGLLDDFMNKVNQKVEERGLNYRKALASIPDHAVNISPVLKRKEAVLKDFGVERDPETGSLVFDNSRLLGGKGLTSIQKADTMIKKAAGNQENPSVSFQKLITLHHQLGNLVKERSIKAAGQSTPSEALLKQLQSSVDDILKKNPTYAAMSKKYAEESDLINNLQKSYSLYKKGKMNPQAFLTKIKTVANQPTDFSRDLVRQLDPTGDLSAQAAGIMAKPWTRQGLGGGLASVGLLSDAILAGHNPALAAKVLAGIAATSPRVGGYLALGAGNMARGLGGIASGAMTPQGRILMELLNRSAPGNSQ